MRVCAPFFRNIHSLTHRYIYTLNDNSRPRERENEFYFSLHINSLNVSFSIHSFVSNVVVSFIVCRCFWSFLLLLLSSKSLMLLLLLKLFVRFIYFETLSIHCNELLHTRTFSLSLSLYMHTYAHKSSILFSSFSFYSFVTIVSAFVSMCNVHVPKRKYHLKIVQSHASKVFIFIFISLSQF